MRMTNPRGTSALDNYLLILNRVKLNFHLYRFYSCYKILLSKSLVKGQMRVSSKTDSLVKLKNLAFTLLLVYIRLDL